MYISVLDIRYIANNISVLEKTWRVIIAIVVDSERCKQLHFCGTPQLGRYARKLKKKEAHNVFFSLLCIRIMTTANKKRLQLSQLWNIYVFSVYEKKKKK